MSADHKQPVASSSPIKESDVNNTTPRDVTERVKSTESDSVTLDSLEEEEESLNSEETFPDSSTPGTKSDNGHSFSSNNCIKVLHKQNGANMTSNMNNHHRPTDSIHHSRIDRETDISSSSKAKTEHSDDECNDSFTGDIQTTAEPPETAETRSPLTCESGEQSRTASLERDKEHTLKSRGIGIMDKTCERITPLPSSDNDSAHSSSTDSKKETRQVVRRPRSLTGQLASDPSKQNTRRSSIPCRKSSDHPAGNPTYLSSAKSSPLPSPSSLHCVDSLPSAQDTPSPTPRLSADFGRRSSFSPSPSPRSVDSSPVSSCCASFVQTQTRVPVKGERSGSACETMCVLSASSSGNPCLHVARDTVTSRMRIEKHHQGHEQDHECTSSSQSCKAYLTPYQRKDHIIRDLKSQVQHLSRQLEGQEHLLLEARETAVKEKEQTQAQLQSEVEEARRLAETARREVTSLQDSHEESVKMVAILQQQLKDVKDEMDRKLAQAENIYLEMYKKGRESAVFEREEELELQGKGECTTNATETELRNKLVRTQAELAKWQTIQRHDSYHTTPLPVTEAESTLRFLKDAVFHFLTSDKKTSDEHLRAMIRILKFSEVQRDKITHAIITKRNKSIF